MDFDSLVDDSAAQPASAQQAQPQAQPSATPAPVLPNFDALKDDSDTYSGYGQQLLGTGEAVSKGLIGNTLTNLAERGLTKLGVSGLSPQEQAGRKAYMQSVNPGLGTIAQAAGFGAGMLTGAGEAAGLAKLGGAAQKAVGLGELANAGIKAKLAAGAVRTGTELAALQADNEISKTIDNPDRSIGSAVVNVGLAGLLGGVGGGAFTGLGLAGKGAFNAMGLSDFADRLAERGAMDVTPAEKIEQEFTDAHQTVRQLGTEVGGFNGVGAAARAGLMPDLHQGMIAQAEDVASQIEKTADRLEAQGDKSGSLGQLRTQAANIRAAINPSIDPLTMQPQNQIDPNAVYDAMNAAKRQLGEWGQFNKALVPLAEVPFRNAAKGLGFGLKTALEDTGTWGEVGALQKNLNAAWTQSIPALKDAESKFMQKIGGEPIVDPAKFGTYLNQNGKSTTQTVRQKMMQNFVDAVEKFQEAASGAYEKAGLENPHPPVSMQALKDSYGEQSVGRKLADLWHDKLGHVALGNAAGMVAGQAVSPGIGGIYAGKWVLGPMFGSVIKPIAEKASNMGAYQHMMAFVNAAAKGESKLAQAAGNLFVSGTKSLPQHWIADSTAAQKLGELLQEKHANAAELANVPGQMSYYLPQNSMSAAKTAANAVNVLNAERPSNPKAGPLDAEIPPSKQQEAEYRRKLTVAEQPLMLLQHAKDGTILPQDVATVKSLYPAYYDHMCERVMSAMTDHLHGGGSVPYRTRQGLSILLGQPLDSTMTPQSLQATQATFSQTPPQQQQAAQKTKRGTAPLGKMSQGLQTQTQAREARQARQD